MSTLLIVSLRLIKIRNRSDIWFRLLAYTYTIFSVVCGVVALGKSLMAYWYTKCVNIVTYMISIQSLITFNYIYSIKVPVWYDYVLETISWVVVRWIYFMPILHRRRYMHFTVKSYIISLIKATFPFILPLIFCV